MCEILAKENPFPKRFKGILTINKRNGTILFKIQGRADNYDYQVDDKFLPY